MTEKSSAFFPSFFLFFAKIFAKLLKNTNQRRHFSMNFTMKIKKVRKNFLFILKNAQKSYIMSIVTLTKLKFHIFLADMMQK